MTKKNELNGLLSSADTGADTGQRKLDHINLTTSAQISKKDIDTRFNYEPLLGRHPLPGERFPVKFLGSDFDAPIWVSSMTGGTEKARHINQNLAKVVKQFKLGMGLGSCRSLLDSNSKRFEDFNLRPILGDRPFYANLGIAQIDKALLEDSLKDIESMIERLQVDGLIIHINPLQEWVQPEGDRILRSPLEIIQEFSQAVSYPLIVKEVGQGMGPKSLEALLRLPLQAIEFGAFGGTNFTQMEQLRRNDPGELTWEQLSFVGHSAEQMVDQINNICSVMRSDINCHEFIISGGVSSFLAGYHLIEKCRGKAIYGQASAFISKAQGSYEQLAEYVDHEIQGLVLAKQFLHLKE